MKNYYNETGFGREIMRVIKPTPQQKELIIPILREHANENREAMMELREDQKEIFEETKEHLKEVLNEDQIQRLEDHWNRMRKRFDDRGPERRLHQKVKPNGNRDHRNRR